MRKSCIYRKCCIRSIEANVDSTLASIQPRTSLTKCVTWVLHLPITMSDVFFHNPGAGKFPQIANSAVRLQDASAGSSVLFF